MRDERKEGEREGEGETERERQEREFKGELMLQNKHRVK